MRFIKKTGHQRILFSSDIPFGTVKWELEKVLSLLIVDDKKEWILSMNLKRLTGLPLFDELLKFCYTEFRNP